MTPTIEDKLREAVVGLEEIRRVCIEAVDKVKSRGVHDMDAVEAAFNTLMELGYSYHGGSHWRSPHHDDYSR
jgi:hypothetical protein